jgi:uncharacterized repeat protein (TIGR02543 family)
MKTENWPELNGDVRPRVVGRAGMSPVEVRRLYGASLAEMIVLILAVIMVLATGFGWVVWTANRRAAEAKAAIPSGVVSQATDSGPALLFGIGGTNGVDVWARANDRAFLHGEDAGYSLDAGLILAARAFGSDRGTNGYAFSAGDFQSPRSGTRYVFVGWTVDGMREPVRTKTVRIPAALGRNVTAHWLAVQIGR